MTLLRLHLRYLGYLVRHKWFVFRAGLWTGAPVWRLLIHDWSKFLPVEWGAYAWSFYGPWKYKERPEWLVASFDRAWLHHQHRNAHHWQHWVLQEDRGKVTPLPMPEKLIREMVADWMGAGRAITGQWDVEDWYRRNAPRIRLHPETRIRVHELLALTDVKLDGETAPLTRFECRALRLASIFGAPSEAPPGREELHRVLESARAKLRAIEAGAA